LQTTQELEKFGVQATHGYRLCRSIQDMADVVLRNAPEAFNLLGHSMGGRVALELYRAAPKRVKRLALFNTGTHSVRPGEKEKRYALWNIGKTKGMRALVDTWLPPMVAEHNRSKQNMALMNDMALSAGLDGFEAQIHALLDRPEVETLLPQIEVPTLVGVGSDDVWSPPEQHKYIADAIPNSELIEIEGSGHMLPVEASAEFTEIVRKWIGVGE